MDWHDYLAVFVMLYPGVMAVYWTISGIFYFLLWENRADEPEFMFQEHAPMVSVLIPCYNEADNLDTSIPHLLNLTYPNYELIFINDGSTDDTLSIIQKWAKEAEKIVVIDQPNGGKASAMNNGARHAVGKYIVGIDGDAILDYSAIEYMIQNLEDNPDLGAVTGNPRVRNRSTVLGKLQVAEFSSIIGLIKRSQSVVGTLFTVSGVIMCIRKDVWRRIGGWSDNMITDDIDISWKTQIAGYNIAYEPRALCWVLMPETVRGLYRQRLRWAQGGAEVILKYFKSVWQLKNARLWPLYFEYFITLLWAYSLFAFTIVHIFDYFVVGNTDFTLIKVTSLITFMMFILQFSVSMFIDSRYERKLLRYFISCIWYPYAFWLINSITLMHGFPKALLRDKQRKATWISPDRGVQ
ncbi:MULTISPECIES: poly-beta-1,6-N-acetyl-D-glucosamine synthase [unclassified Neisseria]|uniref:poly-beta-1,6-N-acetyl-D-glucosamine synthase n=1 Tax=unclassified Neisseria TaxID=2623750 RepID=UPI0026659EDD|nr:MULTISPECIES: poly-beta-1,6-N-acetyl-D-glucosamine synthase [unclassified Neisseria]MDO1510950.1 poly-beta-1,6-N-acetyl-D-glucosamine synthase [Neisseria sp. MVDL19-042950]MDO1517210.1 poly-beta-1,6-N-acetyl-D-glucosamine synthase [Neisseria sp. MVDL18-041461]MDO1564573.1 poly-beta-1,6-N-acetyl-D-glucosamine synthase [Neisseria sp. MVDL20-010259]